MGQTLHGCATTTHEDGDEVAGSDLRARRADGTQGGQVERMNRTLKEATVKSFHYETPDQLTSQLNNQADSSL